MSMGLRGVAVALALVAGVSTTRASEEPLPCPALCRMWMGSAAPPLPEPDVVVAQPGPALRLQGAVTPEAVPLPQPVRRTAAAPPLSPTTSPSLSRVPLPPRRPALPRTEPVRIVGAKHLVTAAIEPVSPPDGHAAARPAPIAAATIAPQPVLTATPPIEKPADAVGIAVLPLLEAPTQALAAAQSVAVGRPARPDVVWPPGLDVIAAVMLASPPR